MSSQIHWGFLVVMIAGMVFAQTPGQQLPSEQENQAQFSVRQQTENYIRDWVSAVMGTPTTPVPTQTPATPQVPTNLGPNVQGQATQTSNTQQSQTTQGPVSLNTPRPVPVSPQVPPTQGVLPLTPSTTAQPSITYFLQGQGQGQSQGCQQLVDKYLANDTILHGGDRIVTGQNAFGNICEMVQAFARYDAFNCTILFADEGQGNALVRCTESGTWSRNGNRFANLLSMLDLKWNLFTHKLTSGTWTPVDLHQWLESYTTEAEKLQYKLLKDLWQTGDSDLVGDNLTVSLPNVFFKPMRANGKTESKQLLQHFAPHFNTSSIEVDHIEPLFGDNSTVVTKMQVSVFANETGKRLNRTLWSILNFGLDNKLNALEILLDRPLMFWEFKKSPALGGDQSQLTPEHSTGLPTVAGGLSGGSTLNPGLTQPGQATTQGPAALGQTTQP